MNLIASRTKQTGQADDQRLPNSQKPFFILSFPTQKDQSVVQMLKFTQESYQKFFSVFCTQQRVKQNKAYLQSPPILRIKSEI